MQRSPAALVPAIGALESLGFAELTPENLDEWFITEVLGGAKVNPPSRPRGSCRSIGTKGRPRNQAARCRQRGQSEGARDEHY
jgi:hypothetical protein